jgi:hypothetical protein
MHVTMKWRYEFGIPLHEQAYRSIYGVSDSAKDMVHLNAQRKLHECIDT